MQMGRISYVGDAWEKENGQDLLHMTDWVEMEKEMEIHCSSVKKGPQDFALRMDA